MNKFEVILSLSLLSCAFANFYLDSDNNLRKRHSRFLFISPKVLYVGRNETVCFATFKTNLPTKILVDLKFKGKHYITDHILQKDYECFEMLVPKLKNINNGLYGHIHIQVELNGTTHTKHSQDPVIILPRKHIIFVNTDKTFYKPEDKLKFRILVLNQDLKATENFIIKSIKISNSFGMSVVFWKNVTTEMGFMQLEYQLSQDALLGKWKIEVNDVIRFFYVVEYILPRFTVTLNTPKLVYVFSSVIKITVCAKYMHGAQVNGKTSVVIKTELENFENINISKKLHHGCATIKLKMEKFKLNKMLQNYIEIRAVVAEQNSNQTEEDTKKCFVTNKPFTLKFIKDKMYFQPGLPYYGKLKALEKLIPLNGEVIEICYNIAVEKMWNIKEIYQCSNLTFGHNDLIYFYIPPLKENVLQIRLHARSINQIINTTNFNNNLYLDVFIINRWFSPTNSYIQIDTTNKLIPNCKSVQQFYVYYTTERIKERSNITFYYMIKFRHKIYKMRSVVHTTRKQHFLQNYENIIGGNHSYIKNEMFVDKFILKFKLDPKITAKYQLVVFYVLPNAEIVANNLDVHIQKCLLNKVETIWSSSQYYPGEMASINIQTSSNSLCAISAIDKALINFGESNIINIDELYNFILSDSNNKRTHRIDCISHASSLIVSNVSLPQWDEFQRKKRSTLTMNPYFLYDSQEVFYDFDVSTITNLKIINKPCIEDESTDMFLTFNSLESEVQSLINPNYYDTHDDDKKTTLRYLFPETWLWELVPMGINNTFIYRKMPHSITKWVTNTICISPSLGIGLSKQKEITSFQPFFVELITPYSIRRGETTYLDILIFNYLNYSLPIRVTLGDSGNFDLPIYVEERIQIYCVPAQENHLASFPITGKKLGKFSVNVLAEIESSYPGECGPETILNKRDVVIKEILVEPEGNQVTEVQSEMLCSNISKTANLSWKLDLPHEIILDSQKINLIISADILGPSITNLEKLVTVPTGCGEQIMATLVPNLYILEYLQAIQKLTLSLEQRIKRNLKIGYQRILNYIHDDGSFSAFGYHDSQGSMFLTSFVVNALQKSKYYVYIDQNIIDKAVIWIINHQLENGCFATVSHVFHDMGGTSSENSTAALTSYVLISLIEAGIQIPEKVITNAKYCIRGHVSPDKYTLAISTYALFLVNWESAASHSLQRLLQIATVQDNLMWWSNPGANSTNVEMTSYVLMALLYQNTSKNLLQANSIVRWLISQRGTNGGFISTHDTVTALNAITQYARLMKYSDKNLHLNVSVNDYVTKHVIGPKDRLVFKQQTIENLPAELNITLEGDGCVLIQIHKHYYLNYVIQSESFKLAVEINSISSNQECSVAVISPCVAYVGPGFHSNMAILEIMMPSGYEPDRTSLFKLIDQRLNLKKFEETENQVILYFTELTNEPICLSFKINEYSKVDNRVEANIKLYDYYNPELHVSTMYNLSICQVDTLPKTLNVSKNGN